MKKIFFALAVLMAIAITATGCKSKSTPKTADSVAVEEADTLVTDSISYHSEQDSTVYSTLRIDYPQGEGSLPMAVRKFIAHELSQLSLTATCTEEGNKKTAETGCYPFSAFKTKENRIVMSQNRKHRAQHCAKCASNQPFSQKSRNDAFQHIPDQGNRCRLHAHDTQHIGRPGIFAAFVPDISAAAQL